MFELCETARLDRNRNSNPFALIELYSRAIPAWFQSFPTIGARCPSTSLFVIVPSTSEITTLACHPHTQRCALTVCFPHTDDVN